MNNKNLIQELSQGEKICPLRSILGDPGYCFGEVCQFWDENNCAILSLTQTYKLIPKLIENIDILLSDFHIVLEKLTQLLESLAEEENNYYY